MMARRGAEVPKDRIVILWQECEAADFVLRPGTDVRGGDIPYIVHVEAEKCAHLRLREKRLRAGQTFAAQAIEIDSLLPINGHRSVSRQCHGRPPIQFATPNFLILDS